MNLQEVKDGKLKLTCNGCKEEVGDSSENYEENEISSSDSSSEKENSPDKKEEIQMIRKKKTLNQIKKYLSRT